ncbi:MAG: tetratricopeptide repeat protein [Bifidobacterium bifidum]
MPGCTEKFSNPRDARCRFWRTDASQTRNCGIDTNFPYDAHAARESATRVARHARIALHECQSAPLYFSDPLTIVLSNPGVSRLSEAQIARISPVGIGHANEAEAGVPYYDDIFDEDDECTTADISDPDGSIALGLGGIYYEEGMHYTATSERQKRVDCFRAAEILYRHAAGRGNAIGWLCLGYVYAYDRCEGRYFRSYYNNFGEVPPKPDTDVLAYECFRHAAEAEIAESCYKLGDMLAEGRGCAADHAKALDMFLRAYMCDGYCGRHILHEIHD